jgi:hypothetical protein
MEGLQVADQKQHKGRGQTHSRYNDSADIVPPQLCSTPASSEAETVN